MKISANPIGTNLARFIKAAFATNNDPVGAADLSQKWADSPEVNWTFKSIVDAVDTSTALARYGIASDFLALLRGASAVEKIKSRMFPSPFRVKVPWEQNSPSGGWVPEGIALPVSSAAFGSDTLQPLHFGGIIPVTKELLQFGTPNTEPTISRTVVGAAGFVEDALFLTQSFGAISGVRPASITSSGASSVASTGATAAAIQTDLGSMVAALTSWRDPVWIMRLSTLTAIQARNPQLVVYYGAQPFILGLPVFTSLGSPQQIVLMDAASILIAEAGIDLSTSETATLEMDTEPVQGSLSPFSSVSELKSLWQNSLAAIKWVRYMNWSRTIASGVVVMTVTY